MVKAKSIEGGKGGSMQIFKIKLADLSNDPANARKHDDRNIDSIIASLRRFGQQKPIVIDMNNIVRAGNGTLEAARRLGWDSIDCVKTDLKGSDAIAYAADDLSKLGSGADPLAHVRNQLTAAINKLKTATLANQLLGLFGGISGAGVLGANQTNKTFTGAPGSMTEANFLNVANVVAAKAKLGERGDNLDSIAMHSNVAYYLQQVGMLVFSTSALATGGSVVWGGGGVGVTQTESAYFAGLRVVIDDQLTFLTGGTSTHAVKYPVYLFASGVVSEGIQQDLRLAADRNILSMQDVLAVRMSKPPWLPL